MCIVYRFVCMNIYICGAQKLKCWENVKTRVLSSQNPCKYWVGVVAVLLFQPQEAGAGVLQSWLTNRNSHTSELWLWLRESALMNEVKESLRMIFHTNLMLPHACAYRDICIFFTLFIAVAECRAEVKGKGIYCGSQFGGYSPSWWRKHMWEWLTL